MDGKLFVKQGVAPEADVSEMVRGLHFLGMDSNPNPINTYQENTALDGQLPILTTYDKSVVTANFWLEFGSYEDYKLAKHDIHRIFSQRVLLRLRTDVQPALVQYVKPVPFEINPTEAGSHNSEFSIAFENPSGYKYSLVNSDQLPIGSATDLKEMGMNLPPEETNYTFNTSSFKVYNPSDIEIDPYFKRHELKITSHFSGSSIKLTNTTNGSTWSYNVAANKSDSIILNGINTTKNGNPDSANTNNGNITLSTGWNSITVSGTTDFDVTFSFPFIYLD